MNELLEQFLIECRELIEAATEDLLALENAPGDAARIDGVFRGFHTLKGAAGIVEFPAMGRVLHAAEDILAAVRAGQRPVTGELVGNCLTCLDQVSRWLDEIDAGGDIPTAPDAAAEVVLARLAPPASEFVPAGDSLGDDWLGPFLTRHAARPDTARVAVRYTPDTDCFFRGEDPLALVALVPDILALEVAPRVAWPAADELNPFECILTITLLSAASPDAVTAVLATVAGQVDIRPVATSAMPDDGGFPPEALAVLREQLLLTANDAEEGHAGRLGSAGLVAVNVLGRLGRADAAKAVAEAVARGQRDGNSHAFAAALRAALAPPEPEHGVDETAAPRVQTERALRVDVERIDALVALAGELLVAKNAVGHTARLAAERADPDQLARLLKDQHALLDRLVGGLQRAVIAIRVLPMRQVFRHFPRLVREMARDLGKSVSLVIEGEATEADKAVVEALFEPLLHVVRNALDHGIEAEDRRRAAGKPPDATLLLRATRQGDQVIVEVRDDGGGIDTTRVREVAARRGLIAEAALTEMTDEAVTELIFTPGFSTAASVTGVSGRGVGMDAVRLAVMRMGGRVAIESRRGEGTNVVFTLPFSVMLLRVMTVEAGGQVFGVPIDAVVETTRVPRAAISRLGAAEAIVLRGHAIPLIRLAETLGLAAPGEPEGGDARILVAAVDGQTGALEVERFGEQMDVMLKPMEGLLAGVEGFAGTTLLGDGRVLIVLDLRDMLR